MHASASHAHFYYRSCLALPHVPPPPRQVWSVGGSAADHTARSHFDAFLRAAVAGGLEGHTSPSGEK